MEKIKLADLKLGKDEQGYYLTAKYLVEDDHRIKELTIPKIVLNILSDPSIKIKIVSEKK